MKFTAIVIISFLLLVPIVFADHARYATSSGSYMTGAAVEFPNVGPQYTTSSGLPSQPYPNYPTTTPTPAQPTPGTTPSSC